MIWTALTGDEQALLARRIRDGDPAADESFVKLFGERIGVMMRARIRDREAARELAQDALLAAWRAVRQGRLNDPARLAAFVHGTARNIANNYARARTAAPRLMPLTDDLALPAQDEGAETERRAIVAAAVRELGAEDRRILYLTLVGGLHPREIAVRLGISPDAARARKSRATRRVMDTIAKLLRMPADRH